MRLLRLMLVGAVGARNYVRSLFSPWTLRVISTRGQVLAIVLSQYPKFLG